MIFLQMELVLPVILDTRLVELPVSLLSTQIHTAKVVLKVESAINVTKDIFTIGRKVLANHLTLYAKHLRVMMAHAFLAIQASL